MHTYPTPHPKRRGNRTHPATGTITFTLRLVLFIGAFLANAAADDLGAIPNTIALTRAGQAHQVIIERQHGGLWTGDITETAAFTTSNPNVATVNDSGVITAVGNGAAVITAAVDDQTTEIAVTVSGADQPFQWSFRNHIQPILFKMGCSTGACHGAAAGKNGFRLSLRSFDNDWDHKAVTRQANGRRISLASPDDSLLLLKPTMAVPHDGGLRFEKDSEAYTILKSWIMAGAPPAHEDDPVVERIEVMPDAVTLTPASAQQLVVRAHYSNGTYADVTRWAKFGTTDESVALVNDDGRVTVEGAGAAAITVWYASKVTSMRLMAPRETAVDDTIFAKAERFNFVDEKVLDQLAQLRIPPAGLCTDTEFIRRAYLDCIGVLPTPSEVFSFIMDSAPDKRVKLVEALLARPEFVDYWSYKWSDLLLLSSRNLPDRRELTAFYQFIRASAEANVAIDGFNLGGETFALTPPADARHDTTIPLPIAAVEGSPIPLPAIAVSAWGEALEQEPNDTPDHAMPLTAPGSVSAVLDGEHDQGDLYRITLAQHQRVILETMAARLGSPIDTVIEVLDASGQPLQRGLIRCVAETFLTLSGRDSRSGGMRLDAWRDMAIGDYLMVGSEIVKISRLPDYADEDASLETYASGQRIGYFGTTPEHHAVNTRIYKVEIHPPGTQLPPNGKPVYPLYWRNDDGFFGDGTANGDSQLEFVAPADGDYLIRVSDVMDRRGPEYGYRLVVREPVPDYDVVAGPFRVNVAPGSRVPVDVRVRRKDGFNEPVTVALHDLPEGIRAEPDVIRPGEDSLKLALVAEPGASSTPLDATFRITAQSTLHGEAVTRETRIGPITVTATKPDLIVRNHETQLALAPDSSGWIGVELERVNGFNSRVPIDVLNLPEGVRVLDTGLNGILVREGEHERRMELYAEPWVEPMTRTIYVQARIETLSPQQPIFLSQPITLSIGAPTLQAKAH